MNRQTKQTQLLEFFADNHKVLYGQLYNFLKIKYNDYPTLNIREETYELLYSYINIYIMLPNDKKLNRLYEMLLKGRLHNYIYGSFRLIVLSPRSFYNYHKKGIHIISIDNYVDEIAISGQENNYDNQNSDICLADLELVLYTNNYINDNDIIPGTNNKGFFLKQIFIDIIFNKIDKKDIIIKYNFNTTAFYKQIKIFNSYLTEVLQNIIEEDDKFMGTED